MIYAIVNNDEEIIIRNGCVIGYDEVGTRFASKEEAYKAMIDAFGEGYMSEDCIKQVG